jgi:hypothetical protein
MKTALLELAMTKAAELPKAAQDQIARVVLERIGRIERLRSELEVGIRQLDDNRGAPLDIKDVLKSARDGNR